MEKLNFISSFYKHNNQYKTWKKYSNKIFGIDKDISKNEDIESIICTSIDSFNKETYSIKSIVDESRKLSDRFVLLNSDIELSENNLVWETILKIKDCLIIGNRYDYGKTYSDGKINPNGIDFFVIDKNLEIPDDHKFCIGLCCWDWWLPILAIKQNIPIYKINQPFIYHKRHAKNWSEQSYHCMRDHFFKATGLRDGLQLKQNILSKCENLIKDGP